MPREVGRLDTPRTARSVRVSGGKAYVGDRKWVRVIDVTRPSAPRALAAYKTAAMADALWVKDTRIYVANHDAGLTVLGLEEN